MNRYRLILFQILIAGLILSGCAGKSKFVYTYPETKTTESSKLILAYEQIKDERTDQSIDEAFENKKPLSDINKIIEDELKSTGLFSKVIMVPEGKLNQEQYLKEENINLLLRGDLREFKWEVPGYKEKTDTIYIVGFLFGGVGAVLYGCVPTDVYGTSTLKVTLLDTDTKRVVIDREYTARSTERKTLLGCDTPATKATVAGNSLKSVMDQFKNDLMEAVK